MQRLHYLLLALYLSCSAEIFERSAFPRRSGDVIIVPESIQDDSFLLLLDSNTMRTEQGKTLDETGAANLVSNLVGGPLINAQAHVQTGQSLFNKNKANLLVFVDSVGSDDLASISDLKIAQRGQKFKINRVAYPQDSIASLTTLITGQTPSVHGIVNGAWMNAGEYEIAYSETTGAKILNFHDQMTQAFDGEPLIISASSNHQMTSAVGVNSRNFFGNNFNLYWNDHRNTFESFRYGNTFGLNVSRDQILNNVETPLAFEDSKEDFLFIAELAFLQNMVKQLENEHFSQFVADKVPDLFAFSFSALKGIKAHASASKFATAVEMMDKTLVEVAEKLSKLYSGKVSVEVVFMGTSASQKLAKNVELKDRVFSLVKEDITRESFDASFPTLYLADSLQQQTVCTRLRQELDYEIFCPNGFVFPPTDVFLTSLTDDGNTTTPTYESATTFQTVLWISIIMLLFILGAVYAIGAIALEVVIDPWLQVRDTKEHQS